MHPIPSTPSPKVYLVDDDRALLDSLSFLFNKAGIDCVAFHEPRDFLNSLPIEGVGCVVADQSMPSMSGISLVHELRMRKFEKPIIFLTACGTVSTAVEAMHLGVVDYLEKPIESLKLLEVVRRSLEIDSQKQFEVESIELFENRVQSLTSRQREVMNYIAEGLPSKQIATKLNISIKTVEVHRSQLARKLGVKSLAALIQMLTKYNLRKMH